MIDFTDTWGERHQVWAVTHPEVLKTIQNEIAKRPLYIADGHHRYDSALSYKREMAARIPGYTGNEGFNFVMTSLIDFADPGLVILPTHRLVRGVSTTIMADLPAQLASLFEIEKIALADPDVWQKVDARLIGMNPDMKKVSLAVFGLDRGQILILTVRNQQTANQMMPAPHGELYRRPGRYR